MMISSHYVSASSSWIEGTPSSLSSAITLLFDDNNARSEDSFEPCSVQRFSDVELRPKDEGTDFIPVTVTLQCEKEIQIATLEVVTNARHMEIYDNRGEYTCTVRGEKLTEEEECQGVNYKKTFVLEKSLPSCSLKLLSLAEKRCLKVSRLAVTVCKVSEESELILPKKHIDMVKVRQLLSTMSQPVPENVEHLMQTVEQYQENQSSVWSDIQQRAQESASRDTSASPMVGMLSMLSRSGELARLSSQTQGGNADSNALTEAMSKMMASASGRHGNAPGANNQLYQSLQGICKNVSQMRRDERQQTAKPDESEKAEKEASGSEKDQQSVPGSQGLAAMLQETMAAQLQALEERMMGRLEKRLDAFEKHIELRLNRIEVLVEQFAANNKNKQSESEGEQGYHGDVKNDEKAGEET
ncbi:uncharacterized protein [Apostichopus japonicus]|uniref:uncharacterized protein n=1 Tax=Stichopus japonicus TaxID=307972 RepID=UPI003AB8350C